MILTHSGDIADSDSSDEIFSTTFFVKGFLRHLSPRARLVSG